METRARTRCIGSGVPGDYFEHGHWILPGTEQGMFPVISAGVSSYSRQTTRYARRRCYLCDSTRRYWRRSTDATSKAAKAHRAHAHKMVKKRLAPDIDTAVAMMNATGLTVQWLAQSALTAIGQQCPGRCFQKAVVDGKPVCQEHIIAEWNDLTLDWRDPRYPLSPENVGWLCPTCNKQKQQVPWNQFMNRQHSIRMNFLQGERFPIQGTLFGDQDVA